MNWTDEPDWDIGDAGEKQSRRSDQTNAYRRKVSSAAAAIGPLHKPHDPERREACRFDLERFLVEYFPESTGLAEFSVSHKRVIRRMQECILHGGRFANAVFRGFAKSTISANAVIWAMSYGHRKFVCLFGAEAEAAADHISAITDEFETNDLLWEDFPEICVAVRHLEGKPQRAGTQHYNGERTHIVWKADKIVLPSIKGSDASGAILVCKGITAVRRGMNHRRVDGTRQRPDLIILDDFQTDESARQPGQVTERLRIINKAVLKLAGHKRSIAIIANGTIIEPDDAMAQLCDHDKNPAWQSERVPFVLKMPDALETFWLKEYAELRRNYDPKLPGDQRRAKAEATKAYLRAKDLADAGHEIAWEYAFDEDEEVSALQHAMNVLIDDGEEAFAAEMQNDPKPRIAITATYADADVVLSRAGKYKRGEIPVEANHVTAFIDVQQEALFFEVCAWADDFTGFVVDYGVFPSQDRAYFSKTNLPATLSSMMPTVSLEGRLRKAIDLLAAQILGHDWMRADGLRLSCERLLIDANWGLSTDLVYGAVREMKSPLVYPSHGRGVTASSKPLTEGRGDKKKKGEIAGLNWYCPSPAGNDIRHVIFDSNYWKSFVHSRFCLERGERSSLSLFEGNRTAHQLFADHITAEYPITAVARGRQVDEWKLRPGRDNEWLDGTVGCAVGASMIGVRILDEQTKGAIKRERRKVRMG